jgi:HEPN domain-containing protein
MARPEFAKYWLLNAEDDIGWAENFLKNREIRYTCIFAQQVAYKSFKALVNYLGFDEDISYSISKLAQQFFPDPKIIDAGKILDKYYISSEKESQKDEQVFFDSLEIKNAENALNSAKLIFNRIKKELSSS